MKSWQRTFVVTGATGFIGGALARSLFEDGHRVVTLQRDGWHGFGVETVCGELEDLRACERLVVEYQPDAVFHLAAQAIVPVAKRDPFGTLESNVRGTYNLLEAFRRHARTSSQFILASSDKAYGEIPAGRSSYHEDDPLQGRGPYDVSKSCADLIAQSYSREYGLRVGIVRAGNVYGPGDADLSRIVPSLVNDIANRENPVIASDGTPVRDYLWIGDAVHGYRLVQAMLARVAANGAGAYAYNLAGGEPCTVLKLVETALEVYHKYWPTACVLRPSVMGRRTGEIRAQVLNTFAAQNELGWRASVSLRLGLLQTLQSVIPEPLPEPLVT